MLLGPVGVNFRVGIEATGWPDEGQSLDSCNLIARGVEFITGKQSREKIRALSHGDGRYRWVAERRSIPEGAVSLKTRSSPFCFRYSAQRLTSTFTSSDNAIRKRASDRTMALTVTFGSAASPTCPHRGHVVTGGRICLSDRMRRIELIAWPYEFHQRQVCAPPNP